MDRHAYHFDPARHADRSVLRGLTLQAVAARTVAAYGPRPAILDGPLRLSWNELAARAASLATALAARGIGMGDVVAVQVPNSWEYVASHLAIAACRAVMVPLHPPYRSHELRTFLAYTDAIAIICSDGPALTRVQTIAADCPLLRTVVAATEIASSTVGPGMAGRAIAARDSSVDVDPADPLTLNPTSGTESVRPKVCMHTHDGLLSNAAQAAADIALSINDVILCASGYTHLFGLCAVHAALYTGATLVALGTFDPDVYLDLCERERVTCAWAVPAQLIDLLAAQRARPRQLVLREVRTGGATVAPELVAELRMALAPEVVIQWGMSELGAGSTTRHGDAALPGAATIGRPLAGAEVRIVGDDDRAVSDGEIGELWYRRADMFRGYLGDAPATAATMTADGWLRTGDLAAIHADGHIAFHGRRKDLINRGGMKISAFELETHLNQLAQIRQAAIVAIPDARLGERAVLACALVPNTTLTLDDVSAHLDARGIAKYKWPEHLVIFDELPMTATRKIAKGTIRSLVAERLQSRPGDLSHQAAVDFRLDRGAKSAQ